jgi:hypothetical protein
MQKMTHKKGISEDISDFAVLNALFGGLGASPIALKFSWRIKLKYFATSTKKRKFFFNKIF